MSNFWFTIIVPNLNQGEFLGDCLNSIVSQEGNFGIELILVDGQSTDDSNRVWTNFLTKIKNGFYVDHGSVPGNCSEVPCSLGLKWKVISEQDKGQSEAINKGLKQSTGDWVNWLCSDDILLPGALKTIHKTITKVTKKIDVVFGSVYYQIVGNDNKSFYRPVQPSLYTFLKEHQGLHQSAVFFRRYLVDKFGFLREDLHFCMDTELYMRWLLNNVKFFRIDTALSIQRLHSKSKSGSGDVLFSKFTLEHRRLVWDGLRSLNFFQKIHIFGNNLINYLQKLFYAIRKLFGETRKKIFNPNLIS